MVERVVVGQDRANAEDIIQGYNRMRTGLILMVMKYGPQTFTRDEALAIINSGQRYPVNLNMGETELKITVEANEEHGRTQ